MARGVPTRKVGKLSLFGTLKHHEMEVTLPLQEGKISNSDDWTEN